MSGLALTHARMRRLAASLFTMLQPESQQRLQRLWLDQAPRSTEVMEENSSGCDHLGTKSAERDGLGKRPSPPGPSSGQVEAWNAFNV